MILSGKRLVRAFDILLWAMSSFMLLLLGDSLCGDSCFRFRLLLSMFDRSARDFRTSRGIFRFVLVFSCGVFNACVGDAFVGVSGISKLMILGESFGLGVFGARTFGLLGCSSESLFSIGTTFSNRFENFFLFENGRWSKLSSGDENGESYRSGLELSSNGCICSKSSSESCSFSLLLGKSARFRSDNLSEGSYRNDCLLGGVSNAPTSFISTAGNQKRSPQKTKQFRNPHMHNPF